MDERLLDAITATRRTIAEFEAVEAGLMAMALDTALQERAPGSGSDLPVRAVAAEIGAAVRVSDRVVQRQLGAAHELTTRFPLTYAAFCAGRLSRAHAAAIVDAGARIADDAARGAYEELAVSVAERESAGRLRGIVKLLAEKVLPRSLDERHTEAAERRGVGVADLDDGMSELRALLPSVLAHGILDRLTRMAEALREADREAVLESEGGAALGSGVGTQGEVDEGSISAAGDSAEGGGRPPLDLTRRVRSRSTAPTC